MPDANAVSFYFTSSSVAVLLRPFISTSQLFFLPVFLFSGTNLFFSIKTILLKVVVLEESALDAVEAATDAVIGKSSFNKDYFELTSGIRHQRESVSAQVLL